MTRDAASPTTHIDNSRTRVTEWHFVPGAHTGWHRHDHDYVIVPMTDGVLDIDTGGGVITRAEMKTGVPYYRETGVEHDVINANDYDFGFVEIEFL